MTTNIAERLASLAPRTYQLMQGIPFHVGPAIGRIHEHDRISAASTRSTGIRIQREPTDRKVRMSSSTTNTTRVPDDGAPREELIKWGYETLEELVGSAQKKGDDALTDE